MCFFKKPEATHMGPVGKAGSCRAGTEHTPNRRYVSKSRIACQTEAWQRLGGAADGEVYQRHRSWGHGVRAAPTGDGRRSGPRGRKEKRPEGKEGHALPQPTALALEEGDEERERGRETRRTARGAPGSSLGRPDTRHLGSAGTRQHRESLPLSPLLPTTHPSH